jgi:hypothetical protein
MVLATMRLTMLENKITLYGRLSYGEIELQAE